MELVATFVPQSEGSLLEQIQSPPVGATWVELRADLLPKLELVPELVRACRSPVLLTYRSEAEGGRGSSSPAEREALFRRWSALPVAFFDLEAARDGQLLERVIGRERALVSFHAPDTPRDLEEKAKELLSWGTRWVKLVPTAASLADLFAVLRLAAALGRGSNGSRRGVVFAQGEVGMASRLLGPLLAAPLAFTAWSPAQKAAPGQFTAVEMRALVGHLSGRPRRVFGVIGRGVGKSLSPLMHTAAYRALGLSHIFLPLEVREEGELSLLLAPPGGSALEALGLPVGGFAVTMPWKEAATRHCHTLAPRAERARAVNTVVPRSGKLMGDLTDVDGLIRVLAEEGVQLSGRQAVVVGTGGAARAAVVALQLMGGRVVVVGRNPQKVEALAREFGVSGKLSVEAPAVVVNATPAGGEGEFDPLQAALPLGPETVVCDLPYGERETFLAQQAKEVGARYVSGKEVLLYQGVSQFAAMNLLPPPVRAMAAALGLEEVQG